MHRLAVLAAALVVLAGVLAYGRGGTATFAQDATPSGGAGAHAATAAHPVAGAWTWVNGSGEDAFPSVAIFHADGTYTEVLPWGAVLMGVWRPTGERTAAVTQVLNWLEDDGRLAQGQGRATVEVDETGTTMTWHGVFLGRYRDGSVAIADPGSTSIGTRLAPAPMVPLDVLAATPVPFGAATPVP